MLLADVEGSLRLSPVQQEAGLAIRLDVAMDRGSWSSVDRCLAHREVRRLIRWLRDIGRSRTPKMLDFTEPNLRFECFDATDQAVRIRTWFEGEMRPPWAPYEHHGHGDLWLDLHVSRQQVRDAAAELTAEIEAIESR